MADKLESLKKDLRSVLLTEKNGIAIGRLDREYREVTGCGIEYDRSQHRSLESFLMTMPDTVTITKYDGQTICSAVFTDKQAGIQRLIRQQKTDSRKRALTRRPLQSYNMNYLRPLSSRPIYAKRFNNTPTSNGSNNDSYPRRRAANSQSNGSSNGTSNDCIGRRSTEAASSYSAPRIVDRQHGAVFDVRAQSGLVSVQTFKPEDQKPQQAQHSEQQPQSEPQQPKSKPQQSRSSISHFDVRHQKQSNEDGVEKVCANRRLRNRSTTDDADNNRLKNGRQKRRYSENGGKLAKFDFEIYDDESNDYKFELSDYAKEHGLPEPQYVSSSYVDKGRVIAFFSKVQVGDRSWLIYPVCYRTPEAADTGAAKKALEELRLQKSNGDVPVQTADDLLHKLAELLADQSLFEYAVEDEFLKRFNRKLEGNWLALVENSKAFHVHKIQTGRKLIVTVALSQAYLGGEIKLDSREAQPMKNDVANDVSSGPNDQKVANGQKRNGEDAENDPYDEWDSSNDEKKEVIDPDDEWTIPCDAAKQSQKHPDELVDHVSSSNLEKEAEKERTECRQLDREEELDKDAWQVHKLVELFTEKDLDHHDVEDAFLKRFNRKLEPNWFELVKNRPLLFCIRKHHYWLSGVETWETSIGLSLAYSQGKVTLVGDRAERKAKKQKTNNKTGQDDASDQSFDQTANSQDEKVVDSYVKMSNYSQNLPGQLPLDRDNDWTVLLLSVTNWREIIIRLTENTDKLDSLNDEMNHFYNVEEQGEPVKRLILSRIYAAVFDGAVFRVQAMLQEGDQVHCYFLDDGVFEKIGKANLRELNDRFMKLPFQAFKVQLDGLEGKSESLFRKYFDELMRFEEAQCFIAQPTSYDPITVRLFDTRGVKDFDVNADLLEHIHIHGKIMFGCLKSVGPSELPAKLMAESGHPVSVTSVRCPNSFIIRSAIMYQREYKQMEIELDRFYSAEEPIPLNRTMVFPGLFVSVKADDDQWYRARIEKAWTDEPDRSSRQEPSYEVLLIDVGRTNYVELDRIQPLYSQFQRLPTRVTRASLNLVPNAERWDSDAIHHFEQLMDQHLTAHDCECVMIESETYVLMDLKDIKGKSMLDDMVVTQMARRN